MTWLETIVAARRASLARERESNANTAMGGRGRDSGAAPLAQGAPRGDAGPPPLRPFGDALRAPGRRIIAEIKRRSPSAGVIRDPLDPAGVASLYARAGAAALSVLTEPEFFGGSDADLRSARAAVSLPVLRKDFVVDREQVRESRRLEADAILVIVAALEREEITALLDEARAQKMDALVEVHSESELDLAIEAGSTLIGVNSRDLRDFTVDLGRAIRLGPRIPDGIVRVAESGIRTREDVARLEQSGFTAFLVGESLLRATDPAARLEDLFG